MFKALIFATIVGVIAANSHSEWVVFKAKYGKVYSQQTDFVRRIIWEDTLKKIEKHNELFAKGLSSYYLGENEYADMTQMEFIRTMNGFKGVNHTTTRTETFSTSGLPAEVDWVKKGYVTPVKNQGPCGSCWAFSSTGGLEGAHFKKTGKLISLSEKNLVDCVTTNDGCAGGWMDNSFKYVIANKGLDTEASYPYEPKQGDCKYNPASEGTTEVSYTDITSGSENALQAASATIGPISVAIDASSATFQMYKGGVYDNPKCSSTALDHAVLVVGYGTYHGKDYWLVKNSWGSSWGLKGYIMMSRNKNNQCGIATHASYPVV